MSQVCVSIDRCDNYVIDINFDHEMIAPCSSIRYMIGPNVVATALLNVAGEFTRPIANLL